VANVVTKHYFGSLFALKPTVAPSGVFQLKAFDHSGARDEAGQAVLEF
jgi:hypothetical protein